MTFLGTTSAVPQGFRNVSGTYVDFPGRGGLMVDCGEDSFGQMQRRFGREDALQRLRDLQTIWVSHMHADHHGGLYPLLQRRQRLMGAAAPPLLIVGPWPLLKVLQAYSQAVHLRFHFLPNDHFARRNQPNYRPPPDAIMQAYAQVMRALGLKTYEGFPVQHVSNSSGLKLEGEKGWTVVFSGDTRPCEAVLSAAKDATLLVHEATFEDEMQSEAVAKRHSTTGEAVSIGARSGAYRTVLTHFSSRYPRLPVLDLSVNNTVGVAFDFMTINLMDLPRLPALVPALEKLLVSQQAEFEAADHS